MPYIDTDTIDLTRNDSRQECLNEKNAERTRMPKIKEPTKKKRHNVYNLRASTHTRFSLVSLRLFLIKKKISYFIFTIQNIPVDSSTPRSYCVSFYFLKRSETTTTKKHIICFGCGYCPNRFVNQKSIVLVHYMMKNAENTFMKCLRSVVTEYIYIRIRNETNRLSLWPHSIQFII